MEAWLSSHLETLQLLKKRGGFKLKILTKRMLKICRNLRVLLILSDSEFIQEIPSTEERIGDRSTSLRFTFIPPSVATKVSPLLPLK